MVFVIAVSSSDSVVLNCTFVDVAVRFRLTNIYSCQAEVIRTGDELVVETVMGTHSPGKSNLDVKSIEFVQQNTDKLYRKIESFFPNLEGIFVHKSGLKVITKEDVNVFPKLRQLDLFLNSVEEIDGNLFEQNPLIEAFSVFSNPIRSVGYNIFDHLTLLETVHLVNGKCISDRADSNRDRVKNIMFNLTVKCPPTFQMIERRVLEGDKIAKLLNDQETALTEKLQNKMEVSLTTLENALMGQMREKLQNQEDQQIKPFLANINGLQRKLGNVESMMKSCICLHGSA